MHCVVPFFFHLSKKDKMTWWHFLQCDKNLETQIDAAGLPLTVLSIQFLLTMISPNFAAPGHSRWFLPSWSSSFCLQTLMSFPRPLPLCSSAELYVHSCMLKCPSTTCLLSSLCFPFQNTKLMLPFQLYIAYFILRELPTASQETFTNCK